LDNWLFLANRRGKVPSAEVQPFSHSLASGLARWRQSINPGRPINQPIKTSKPVAKLPPQQHSLKHNQSINQSKSKSKSKAKSTRRT
jgi:hypothetical protein